MKTYIYPNFEASIHHLLLIRSQVSDARPPFSQKRPPVTHGGRTPRFAQAFQDPPVSPGAFSLWVTPRIPPKGRWLGRAPRNWIVKSLIQEEQCSCNCKSRTAISSHAEFLKVQKSVSIKSTSALWIWRKSSILPLTQFYGRSSGKTGSRVPNEDCLIPDQPEKQLFSYCWQLIKLLTKTLKIFHWVLLRALLFLRMKRIKLSLLHNESEGPPHICHALVMPTLQMSWELKTAGAVASRLRVNVCSICRNPILLWNQQRIKHFW